MAASVTVKNGKSVESVIVKPPVHPTYDLKGVIKLALSEDAGDKGLVFIDFVLVLLRFNYLKDMCIEGVVMAKKGEKHWFFWFWFNVALTLLLVLSSVHICL